MIDCNREGFLHPFTNLIHTALLCNQNYFAMNIEYFRLKFCVHFMAENVHNFLLNSRHLPITQTFGRECQRSLYGPKALWDTPLPGPCRDDAVGLVCPGVSGGGRSDSSAGTVQY